MTITYADLDDQKSWIERYTVQCNKMVRRSLLMVIRGSVLEESSILLPGETIADPLLQMNALGSNSCAGPIQDRPVRDAAHHQRQRLHGSFHGA